MVHPPAPLHAVLLAGEVLDLDAGERYVAVLQTLRGIVGGLFMLVGALVTALRPVSSILRPRIVGSA